MIRRLGLVVEGHGDVEAARVLIRRLAHESAGSTTMLDILRPVRIKRQRIHAEDFERVVTKLGIAVGEHGAVLVLIDADEDCPASLGPWLLRRATAARMDRAISVVLANRMFESWFLASLESLRGVRNIPMSAVSVIEPEETANPKRRLKDLCGYSPVADQAALAAKMDLPLVRQRAPSFDKLCREVGRLLGATS